MEISVINKSIKFFIMFLISFNVFAGGDDRDDAYYANLDEELAAFEAQIAAEAASQEMMVEIEREMALDAFLQKLADEKAAAAASTAAYQASLDDDEVIGVIEEVVVTEAAHEACKYALNLSESNVALFKSALADGSLFNVGPQASAGTEFTANRWDAYANCVSNYVNPF